MGGDANPSDGAPTQYIYTFSGKPHEIIEILVRGGGAPGALLLNPPLTFEVCHNKKTFVSESIEFPLMIFTEFRDTSSKIKIFPLLYLV